MFKWFLKKFIPKLRKELNVDIDFERGRLWVEVTIFGITLFRKGVDPDEIDKK